eukprot:8464704-Prorocentrum_lima.AAC.1
MIEAAVDSGAAVTIMQKESCAHLAVEPTPESLRDQVPGSGRTRSAGPRQAVVRGADGKLGTARDPKQSWICARDASLGKRHRQP